MWRVLLFSIFISSPLFAKTISFACVEDIIHAEGIYLAFAKNQVTKVQETYIYDIDAQTIDIAGTKLVCEAQDSIIQCKRFENDADYEYSWNLIIDQKSLSSKFHKVGFYADRNHEIKTQGSCNIKQ
jgi:hypothetical protein